MGAAKRKREELRKALLEEMDKWSFPSTEWETRTVEEIRKLPVVKVRRYPDDTLAWMRMPPRQCHANARFMQENDPERRARQVTGWWVQEGDYLLHSVVARDGEYLCVTPAPLHQDDLFDFIPDPKIEWREEGDHRVAYRDDVEIGPGVRSDPVGTLAKIEEMRARLLSGMNPYEVVKR